MPSFSIEVPGEANPLALQLVHKTLVDASGGQQQAVRVATEQLANWEKQPGFYSLLQDVYVNLSVDPSVRFQAIIQLKNGVDKRWRKTLTNAIGKQERIKIRSTALEFGIVEPVAPLRLQNALMLAKIVRHEFPHDWPDAVTQIINHLQAARPEQRANVLLIALQVIKELASGKLQRTRKNLEQVAPELLAVFRTIYLDETPQNSYLAVKSIRRLLVSGFEHPHRDTGVEALWRALHEQHAPENHLVQLAKLDLEMARSHPASFALLPGVVAIVGRAWMYVKALEEDKLALRSLLLLRACIKMVFHPSQTFRYQHPQDKEDRKLSVDVLRSQVLTRDFVLQLLETLMTKYFPLTEADLQEWQDDPDEYTRKDDEITDSWEFSMRPCAEKLFLDLVVNFKLLVVPKLLQVFEARWDVFQREAVYSSIGLAAASLDALDFNAFLQRLRTEVRSNEPFAVILRRRIAILIAQWAPILQLNREAVWDIFTFLLADEDQVVKVTAGRQLKPVLEPMDDSGIEPYAPAVLKSLMELVLKVESTETKIALLESLNGTILKLNVEPYAADIMTFLSRTWTENSEEHLLHQTILTVITAIMTGLGDKAAVYVPTIVPLIKDSITSEAQLYLMEETLELWSTIIPFPQSLTLFENVLPLLEMGSDSLPHVLEICTSYLDLAPVEVLKSAKPLLTAMLPFLEVLGSSRATDAKMIPQFVEDMASSLDRIGQDGFNYLVQSMIDSGFFAKMLELIKEAHDYHEEPTKRPPDVVGPSETLLFSIIARLCLFDVSIRQLLEDWVIKEFIRSADTIGDIERKKVQVMALTKLFGHTQMIDFLAEMMTLWTDLLLEIDDDELRRAVSAAWDMGKVQRDFSAHLAQVDSEVLKAFGELKLNAA